MLVARYLTEMKTDRIEIRDLLKLGALIGVPMALVNHSETMG